MKSTTSSIILTSLSLSSTTSAFSFMAGGNTSTRLASTVAGDFFVEDVVQQSTNSGVITDPLSLYPKNSQERNMGVIEPLEASLEQDRTIIDPLSLYQDRSEVTNDVVMSQSLPFLKQPMHLDGSLPGDRGFDPFNLAAANGDASTLNWYREAELKHGRIAMLATVGWAVSELSHNSIASTFGLPSILDSSDKVPSVLNGGLDRINPFFWMEVICVAAVLEFISIKNDFVANGTPGAFNFDPLGIAGNTAFEKFDKKEAELFNGRLAMLAITGFAIQEFTIHDAIIHQLPSFF